MRAEASTGSQHMAWHQDECHRSRISCKCWDIRWQRKENNPQKSSSGAANIKSAMPVEPQIFSSMFIIQIIASLTSGSLNRSFLGEIPQRSSTQLSKFFRSAVGPITVLAPYCSLLLSLSFFLAQLFIAPNYCKMSAGHLLKISKKSSYQLWGQIC